jgi:hypothetical protein
MTEIKNDTEEKISASQEEPSTVKSAPTRKLRNGINAMCSSMKN